jgi:hypothetical protein
MKCTVCGAYNKPEYKKCIRCGKPLVPDEDTSKQKKILVEHQSPLKNTPTFREALIVEEKKEEEIVKDIKPGTHTEVPEDTDLWSGKKKKRHIHGRHKSVPVLSLKDESEETETHEDDEEQDIKRRVRRYDRPAKDSNLDKLSKVREGQEVEVILPPEAQKKKAKTKKKKKRNLKWGRLILVSATAGVLIIGLVIGFFYLFRGIFSGISPIFSGHEALPNDGKPLVERVMTDGMTWHRITFYGEDGERVLVESPIQDSLSIQGNRAILMLDDSSFIPEEDTQDESMEYVEVDLQASLFNTDGQENLLDVPAYKIPVPPSPLKIVYPTDPNIKVEYTQVLVKIKVEPGSRVLIDDVNLTDVVDSDGYVQKYVNLKEGENNIEINVETYKHRRTLETVTVSRPELDVMIELNSPDSEHNESDIWIEGYTEPNTTIDVDSSRVSAEVSYEAAPDLELEDGTTIPRRLFKFRYVLNSFGWNDIKMLATTSDGRTAELIHRVNRIPDHRSYTRTAWPLFENYEYLSTSTQLLASQNQVFECKGEVIRRTDTDTSRMYLFNIGSDSDVKYVMLEYSGNQQFELNKYYKVYADVTGTYDNYPLLTARFIYDMTEEEVAALQEKVNATPEPTEEPTPEPTE